MPRPLRCKNLNDIRADLTLLEKSPVETTGNWSYFQIITHLTQAVEGSMKGLKREMPWWKKHILGPLLHRLFVMKGYIPAGIKGRPVERVEGNEAGAVAQFRKALDAFEKFEGPLSDHPILGQLNKKQWASFHPLHFQNHARHVKSQKHGL